MKNMLVMLLLGSLAAAQEKSSTASAPVPVARVDLGRYVGTWYEVAKIPNTFQKQCAGNTTATYSLRPDGRIEVVNRCTKADGSIDEARGVARVVDTVSNAKLEVSFVRFLGIQLFWGDYWIIGLDKDYRYAVVGTPTRKYGWILSRTPKLGPEDSAAITRILTEQGYDRKDFVETDQNP